MKPLKRTESIRLVLIGPLCAGLVTGCSQNRPAPVSSEAVYTNNYYLPGVGYYHAPFCAWYPRPFNDYDPARTLYYYGGQWGSLPFDSITNVSSPSPQTAAAAEAARLDIPRGGFGGTGGGYHGYWGG
jgi:hypothetical protein